jgi:GR25 family glycosyltransferase involved in LPS biosynthesis
MGCTLTHLSIVHDAWHAGYQTIWVLEDDITVKDDPRLLADFVDKLDSYTEWDVLYTDCEDLFSPKNVNIHYGGRTWMRPDRPITKALSEWALVGEDFLKIAGRSQAHSYLLRRSGMQKILEFVMSQGLFLPFDFELASVPDIRLYNLRHDIVHGNERDSSDTYKSN